MLSLLTLLSMAMYFSGRIATQSSRSVQTTTEAYYFAETAVNYMTWALLNDAEFDNHAYTGRYIHGAFGEPPTPVNPLPPLGDYKELRNYLWNPGPTLMGSDAGNGIGGQVKYFDNSPMNARPICFESSNVFPNCTDVTLSPGDAKRVSPTLYHISTKLPRYIRLDISSAGVISAAIPKLPHRKSPVVGEDIPENGAVVWLTAGDPNNANRDIEVFPLDPKDPLNNPTGYYGAGVLSPTACFAGKMNDPQVVNPAAPVCPCPVYVAGQACDAHANGNAYKFKNMGGWLPQYNIVIYAIGYVNGRPSHMLRALVQ